MSAGQPRLDLVQEVDPVGDGAPGVGRGEGFARRRLERAEDVALAAPPVVDLLLRSPPRAARRRQLARRTSCWPGKLLADSGPISSRQITTLPQVG